MKSYEGTDTTIHDIRVEIGDLLEVKAGDNEYWYGEYNGKSNNPSDIIITYIEKDEDGIYAFQDVSYDAPRDSINNIQSIKNGKKSAWREMGFVYCGRNEILSVEDVDEQDEDRDWDPDKESESESEEDCSDDTSSDVSSDNDEISDVIDSNDEEDESESDEPSSKKLKK